MIIDWGKRPARDYCQVKNDRDGKWLRNGRSEIPSNLEYI